MLNNRSNKKYIIIIGFLAGSLVFVMGAGSLYLYDYTENDPEFCMNCHIMIEAHHSWETSVHKDVNCHTCHYATLYEKNMMFFKTIVDRPTKVSKRPHDKIVVPSAKCTTCHLKGDKGITNVSRSKGHSLHWFKENIECTSCHAAGLHTFEAKQKICANCHSHSRIMIPKMQNMVCTDCHDFRAGRLVPGNEQCIQCHENASPQAQPAGASRAHQPFECIDCHQVHHPRKEIKTSCAKCHQGAMQRGKHPVHLKALGDQCTTCHIPHQWRITKKSASSLCSQCHKNYPLRTFSKR